MVGLLLLQPFFGCRCNDRNSYCIFCVNVLLTVLRGKIAAGIQRTEQADDDIHKYISDEKDKGRVDLLRIRDKFMVSKKVLKCSSSCFDCSCWNICQCISYTHRKYGTICTARNRA